MWWALIGLFLAADAEVRTIKLDPTNVPDAALEHLGVAARGRDTEYVILAESTDGKGTSAYMVYYDHAYLRDPWEIVEANLGTKQVNRFSSGRKAGVGKWMLGEDGCLYVLTRNIVSRFDPKTRKFEHLKPSSGDSTHYSCHWGPDGKLFLGTYPEAHIVRFDPESGEFHDYGRQGPELKKAAYAYDITGDETYIYVARGKIPWYLIALDIKTGEQTILTTLSQEDTIRVTKRKSGCYAVVTLRAYGAGERKQQSYRLEGLKMVPVEEIPPKGRGPGRPYAGNVSLNGWDVCWQSCRTSPHGTVELWFRKQGEEWQSLKFPSGGSPARIFRLSALSDGRIAGSTDDPYSIFFLAPKAGKITNLGGTPLHIYDLMWLDGKLFLCGYPNAPLVRYDPAKAWTFRPPTPEGYAPGWWTPEANPLLVSSFHLEPFVQKRAYAMALGADGRIYLACKAGREKTGGCLAWYDPKTGKCGGLQEPFRTQGILHVLAANRGKTLLCSTIFVKDPHDPDAGDGQAHVMAYDVKQGRIVGDIVPLKDAEPKRFARLVEWKPGKVVGSFLYPDRKRKLFFLLDVATMKIESQVILDGDSSLPVCLPDDFLYGAQRDLLYRLDPAKWEFTPLAKLPAFPWPMVNIGQDLYFQAFDGDTHYGHLMRLRVDSLSDTTETEP